MLVKKLTEIAIEVYKIEHIIVLIRENPPENVGINGQLLADPKKAKLIPQYKSLSERQWPN